MVIAVDHGNKQIKTVNKIFTSGLLESDTKPPFGANILQYNGKYYTLSEKRIPYMRDKTTDDRFYILSLFAIAFEIEAAGYYPAGEILDVQLLAGLPPKHYGALYEKFEKYFTRSRVEEFIFRGIPYSICISKAIAYPQAYAAAMTAYSQISQYPKVMVIDIGGFTADYLQIKEGQADLTVCDSLEHGVFLLYNQIRSKVNADMALLLDESDIDAILMDKPAEYDENVKKIVLNAAQGFVNDLFDTLRERMIDLRSGKTIFVGGGPILLKQQILDSGKAGVPIFIEQIAANVKGYEILYRATGLRG